MSISDARSQLLRKDYAIEYGEILGFEVVGATLRKKPNTSQIMIQN
ncbi:MAG: hypothetical protein AB2825_03355 [Candidatus Thiodiazotropha endolucinida]